MSKWDCCHQEDKLWLCCQSILQKSRIILITLSISKIWEKQIWHVRILRIKKSMFQAVESSIFKQVNVASKEQSMETSFHTTKIFILKNVPKVIWGHYQEYDKFWPSCTFVNLIQNGFCQHPPHLLLLSHKWVKHCAFCFLILLLMWMIVCSQRMCICSCIVIEMGSCMYLW